MAHKNVSTRTGESLVLTNGIVHTLADGQPRASTVVIRDGRIAAVGDDTIVETHGAGIQRRIDLDGACVVPGFIDTHVHFTITGLGLLAGGVDLIVLNMDQRNRTASYLYEHNGFVVHCPYTEGIATLRAQ